MKVGEDGNVNYSQDDDLSAQFIEWTTNALVELRQVMENLADSATQDSEDVQRIYDLVHNIKGMGASFDFLLMTDIGTSLCGYIKSLDTNAEVKKRIFEAHVRALEVVHSNKITGSGGAQGKALTQRLTDIIHEES